MIVLWEPLDTTLNFKHYFELLKHASETLEAVVQRFSLKKVFLEISQNSQENTCAGAQQ